MDIISQDTCPVRQDIITSAFRIIGELRNPNDDGQDFRKTLTSNQWMGIKRSVEDVSGGKSYWYVEAWDELDRHNQTGVMSFIFADQ